MTISLDYSYMLAPPVTGGIPVQELQRVPEIFQRAQRAFAHRRQAGTLGFMDLPDDAEMLLRCEQTAARFAGRMDDVVILGIGGSALGAIALRTALLRPMWNLLDSDSRGGRPRLHVLDNVDPRTVAALLGFLDLRRTLFVVISKSGSTAETMAQYLIVREKLDALPGNAARENLVFLTDPVRGALRSLALSENILALDVPPNVGGRFSVLSAVGIFPALLTGMNAAALLRGAREMRARCEVADPFRNPAGMYALLQYLSDVRCEKRVNVFMPYSDALRDFALWFVQLWAESLGKLSTRGTNTGPTPLAALGATDQHSQVQLFMEGPPDKTVTFVRVGSHPDDLIVPGNEPPADDLAYLRGHTLGELLDAEQKATAGALAARGRPSLTIDMPVVDAHHVGELIMLLQMATVFAGDLYAVDPLDQPGVELGKQFTYALMGKAGAEPAMSEWNSLPKPDPSRRM